MAEQSTRGTSPYPRPEAAVLAEPLFTEEQRDAAELAELLLHSLARAKSSRLPEAKGALGKFLPRLDRARTNQVVLIDGSRGSGKTTLLVSLIASWQDRLIDPDARGAKDPLEREVLVPLEIIDLHALPPGVHLLMQVAVRFRRVWNGILEHRGALGAPSYAGQGDRLAPWRATGEHGDQSLWNNLSSVIASWEGGAQDRRKGIDPDLFAIELADEATQRLDLETTFAGFMDKLAEDFRATLSPGRTPLFIVPIDDADMNTEKTVELLQLLRIIYHPRLAFLLTGDSDLFLRCMRHDIAKRLDPPPPTLAEQFYDRVIPPAHRCKVPPLGPAQRFTFKLPGAAPGSDLGSLFGSFVTRTPAMFPARTTEPEAVAHLSANVIGFVASAPAPDPRPSPYMSIADLMEMNHRGRPRYRLAAMLPDRLRGLVDLRMVLRGALDAKDPPDATRLFLHLWEYAIERSDLSQERKALLRGVVKRVPAPPRDGKPQSRVVAPDTCSSGAAGSRSCSGSSPPTASPSSPRSRRTTRSRSSTPTRPTPRCPSATRS